MPDKGSLKDIKTLFVKASRAVCLNARRSFNALALGVCLAVLVGFSGLSSGENLPTETKQGDFLGAIKPSVLLSEIKKNANGVPFAFIDIDEFHKHQQTCVAGVMDLQKKAAEGALAGDFAEEQQNVLREFYRQMIGKSLGINGERGKQTEFAKGLDPDSCKINDISNEMANILSYADRTPGVLPLIGGKVYLVVLDNPERLLASCEYERKETDISLNKPGLTEALGPDYAEWNRIYIIAHELAHVGDKESYKVGEEEFLADGKAFQTIYRVVKGSELERSFVEFQKNYIRCRSVQNLVTGDVTPEYATHFELLRLMQKEGIETEDVYAGPLLSKEQVKKGIEDLAFQVPFMMDLLSTGNDVRKDDVSGAPEQISLLASRRDRLEISPEAKALAEKREKAVKELSKNPSLMGPEAQALIKFACNSMEYYENILDRSPRRAVRADKGNFPVRDL